MEAQGCGISFFFCSQRTDHRTATSVLRHQTYTLTHTHSTAHNAECVQHSSMKRKNNLKNAVYINLQCLKRHISMDSPVFHIDIRVGCDDRESRGDSRDIDNNVWSAQRQCSAVRSRKCPQAERKVQHCIRTLCVIVCCAQRIYLHSRSWL